jgi:hypothetical protein
MKSAARCAWAAAVTKSLLSLFSTDNQPSIRHCCQQEHIDSPVLFLTDKVLRHSASRRPRFAPRNGSPLQQFDDTVVYYFVDICSHDVSPFLWNVWLASQERKRAETAVAESAQMITSSVRCLNPCYQIPDPTV